MSARYLKSRHAFSGALSNVSGGDPRRLDKWHNYDHRSQSWVVDACPKCRRRDARDEHEHLVCYTKLESFASLPSAEHADGGVLTGGADIGIIPHGCCEATPQAPPAAHNLRTAVTPTSQGCLDVLPYSLPSPW